MTPPTTDRRRFIPTWPQAIRLLVGLALFIAIIQFGSTDSVRPLLRDINLTYLILSGLALSIGNFVFSMRWRLLSTTPDGSMAMTPFQAFYYNLSALAASLVFIATVSTLAIRTTTLSQTEGMSVTRSAIVSFIDKLFDLALVCILAIPGFLYLLRIISLQHATYMTLLIVGLSVVFLYLRYQQTLALLAWFVGIGTRLLSYVPVIGKSERLNKLIESIRLTEGFHQQTLLHAWWLTLLGQVFLTLRVWFLLLALGEIISPTLALIAVVIVQSSTLISIAPGGLGTIEAGWYIALSQGISSEGTVTAYLILSRGLEIVAVTLTWAIVYFVYARENFGVQRQHSEANQS